MAAAVNKFRRIDKSSTLRITANIEKEHAPLMKSVPLLNELLKEAGKGWQSHTHKHTKSEIFLRAFLHFSLNKISTDYQQNLT